MEQKIKILMIADTPRNLAEIKGGLEAATVNLIMGFRNLPVEVHVITIKSDIVKKADIKIHEGCTIHYQPYTIRKLKFAEFVYFGHQKIKRLYKEVRPDIIHNQGTGPMLMMLLGFDKRKVVITQHGIMSEELKYKTSFARRLKFRIKMLYDKFLLPRFDNYISISEYNRNILETYQKKNNKFFTRIISNPVNDNFFETRPPTEFTKIVFVGLVNKLKGVHILLEALLDLRQQGVFYTLDIAGGTKEPDYLNMIENMIEQKSMDKQVKLHGWVGQEEVKKLIEGSAVFLLPSLQECLPISIAEAMAAERVIIATNTGGIPEMFVDKESGFLFRKNDAKELADILKNLYNNKNEILRVASNGKKEALRKFQSKSVAEKTLEYYSLLIKKNNATLPD